MNERTLRALEYHKIIDILSLYTVSELGKEIAISLKPSKNLYEIKEWQEETEEAVNLLLKRGSFPLEGIYDIRNPLRKAEMGSILDNAELLRISYTLATARRLKSFIKEERNDNTFPIIEDLISILIEDKEIESSINNVIENEEEIFDRASPELYSLRRKIKNKNVQIKDKMNHMATSIAYERYLQEQIVTLRGDRYVLPVKQEYRSSVPGIVHDQSSSGATLYIEPMAIVDMNNDLRQLKLEEKDEILRILADLSMMVAGKYQEIETCVEILATLDFIFAKAKFSLEYACSRPQINNEGRLNIIRAKHPLIHPEKVVPIDVRLGRTFNILVITGPNTGGKTVSLKTIGLLTLMAQSGLQIPAKDKSEIGIFDEVFADIGDEQSIEQNLSTFSSHMKNIISIIEKATENSLVLLDELGAGTDPTEGAALAMAILDLFRHKQIRVVATTHYSELKVYALTTPGLSNGNVEFDIDTLQPTYKLSIGMPGKSNAFEISRKLGLQENIINMAREFISKDKIKFEDIIVSLEESKKKADEERASIEQMKYDIEKEKEEAKKVLNKALAEKDRVLKKAYIEAEKLKNKHKAEIDELMEELRESIKKETQEKRRISERTRLRMKDMEDELKSNISSLMFKKRSIHKPPKKLKLGDTVKIVNLDQKGSVLTLPDENDNLMVQVGIMKINVNKKDLYLIEDEDNDKIRKEHIKISKPRTNDTPLEVDLRGKTLDEALMELDKYLDDAYLSNIKNITIIHGKGTGVLRTGVTQFLRTHPHVKSFRLGGYYEGGHGATLAKIK